MWALCNLVTPLNRTPTFDWYVARFLVKNGHQDEDIMCYDGYFTNPPRNACVHLLGH